MTMGRPNKGLEHVSGLAGEPQAKERMRAILATLLGELSVQQACEQLGIQRAYFQQLRQQALQGAIDALTPQKPGRKLKTVEVSAAEISDLRQAKADLEDELLAMQARVALAMTMPHLLRGEPKKKTGAPQVWLDQIRALFGDGLRRRGRLLVQEPRRQLEQGTRGIVVSAVQCLLQRGRSLPQSADRIGMACATTRHWLAESQESACAKNRGRRAVVIPRAQRQQAIARLRRRRRSVCSLLRMFPRMGRNATAELVARYRRVRWRRQRRNLCRLEWLLPHSAWAIDGTWLSLPVRGSGRRALLVVDLQAHAAISFESVPGESAPATIACLERLIARHGAPLVLKLDNGSAFISAELRTFCERHQIELLHSPVRRPSFNGTVEVSARWSKVRAVRAACAAGRAHELRAEDLAAACQYVDDGERIDPEVRARFRAAVRRQLQVACDERGLAGTDRLRHTERASLERVAVQRALQECHILMIRGRDYRR